METKQVYSTTRLGRKVPRTLVRGAAQPIINFHIEDNYMSK